MSVLYFHLTQVIEDLARQVKSLEREREQTTSRLRNMETEMIAISRRLEESGINLETERKMERAQQDLRMQLSEVQNTMRMQRQSGVTESAYSDDVLTSVTRELHDLWVEMDIALVTDMMGESMLRADFTESLISYPRDKQF